MDHGGPVHPSRHFLDSAAFRSDWVWLSFRELHKYLTLGKVLPEQGKLPGRHHQMVSRFLKGVNGRHPAQNPLDLTGRWRLWRDQGNQGVFCLVTVPRSRQVQFQRAAKLKFNGDALWLGKDSSGLSRAHFHCRKVAPLCRDWSQQIWIRQEESLVGDGGGFCTIHYKFKKFSVPHHYTPPSGGSCAQSWALQLTPTI